MTSTTTTTTIDPIDEDGSNEEGDEDEDEGNVKVWIPVVLTVVMVTMICAITVYAKAKRRRDREAGTSDPARTVSGGVAMNVNVYRNYGVYVNTLQPGMHSAAVPAGVAPGQPLCTIPYSSDGPPSYEDIIKDTPHAQQAMVIPTAGASGSADTAPPPPYTATPAEDQQRTHPASPQPTSSTTEPRNNSPGGENISHSLGTESCPESATSHPVVTNGGSQSESGPSDVMTAVPSGAVSTESNAVDITARSSDDGNNE